MAFLSVLHRHGQLSWNVPDPARYRKRSSVDLGSRFDGQTPRMEQVQGAVWAAEGTRAWELLLLMLLPGSREPREMPCSKGLARGGCTRLFVVIVRAWSRFATPSACYGAAPCPVRCPLPRALLLPTAARAWELLLLMLLPGSREPREMPCSKGLARGGCTRLFVVIVRAWSRCRGWCGQQRAVLQRPLLSPPSAFATPH
ncbi:unnamed protein product [Lampetra planeri]